MSHHTLSRTDTIPAGIKFSVSYFDEQAPDRIEVWLNKTTLIGIMRGSVKRPDGRVFAGKVHTKGQHTLDLKIGEGWYTIPVTIE
jgi:hypothetical protein